jgi:hypothetical protein
MQTCRHNLKWNWCGATATVPRIFDRRLYAIIEISGACSSAGFWWENPVSRKKMQSLVQPCRRILTVDYTPMYRNQWCLFLGRILVGKSRFKQGDASISCYKIDAGDCEFVMARRALNADPETTYFIREWGIDSREFEHHLRHPRRTSGVSPKSARQVHVQQLTEAFYSPPCRNDFVSSSVGSHAVGVGEASVGNEFVSPPVREEYLPTQNLQREEPTTWQGFEARRLCASLTATGQDEIARRLMHEFDETDEGDMCAETLRQYSNIADAPSQRGEVGSEDEHTASPNRNTRNAKRSAGSSSSYWPKRGPDSDRFAQLEDANTSKAVAKGMRECKRGCGSSFIVRGAQKRTPPVEEIMNMREDLVTLGRTQLRNMLYGFLRHEGGGGLEVPVATKDAIHKMFTVKTAFFCAKMCLTCMAALFLVSSPL